MRSSTLAFCVLALALVLAAAAPARSGEPVYVLKEAEDFKPADGDWQAKPWGTNYYAATFANVFLSRQAYLGAPEQGAASRAVAEVDIPAADTYLVLVRYEAAYRFQTQFNVSIEQNGQVVFNKTYGALDNPKIWFFTHEPTPQVRFSWSPVENIVWEGHANKVALQPGKARITLSKGQQPEPAARRNVDVVLLTNNETDVLNRIQKEGYLPLDGLLTQKGDLFVKIKNNSNVPILLSVPPCTQHSPYWIHVRTWQDKLIGAHGEGADRNKPEDWLAPGQESPLVEVGSLLDTLNDSGWQLSVALQKSENAALSYTLAFASPNDQGQPQTFRTLDSTQPSINFSVPGGIRARRELPTWDELADKLVAEINKFPKKGKAPDLMLFYPRPGGSAIDQKIENAVGLNTGDDKNSAGKLVPEDYDDVRSIDTDKLQAWCDEQKAKGRAEKLRIISLGDEIGLGGAGPGPETDARFRIFLQEMKLKPGDVVPGAQAWDAVSFDPKSQEPHLYYYARLFSYAEGRRALKERTDILRKNLPNALVGANYSPHPFFWPEVNQWVSVFKDEAMTMPWSEDYAWQIAMTSQQVLGYILDAFRCGAKYHDQLIYMYVMPHSPGNTPNSFRRCFYEDIAHGVKYFNYFTPIPPTLSYTENHVSERDIPMWRAMHDVIREAGVFEDIVYNGRVRPAEVAVLLSESSEIWNSTMLFNAEKQHIWMALKHAQLPVDFLIEDDLADGRLKSYKVLYLVDPCVRSDASKAIADWVGAGGFLFATAGAGMQDEFNQPNKTLRDLFGVEPQALEIEKTDFWGKADLPFLKPLDEAVSTVSDIPDGRKIRLPVLLARQKFALTAPADQYSKMAMSFASGGNAFSGRMVGKGGAIYAGFFPGMAYAKPAIPMKPCDRGSTDDAMAHFIPTAFDLMAAHLILEPIGEAHVRPLVECSVPLVETSWIDAKAGIAVPLVNWSGAPIEELTVRVKNPGRPVGQVSAASESEARWKKDGDDIVVTLPLDVADLLILRP